MLLTVEFCAVAFCFVWSMTNLLVTLEVIMCEGVLAGYLKSWLHLHLLWQIVCPTCWGLVSYASRLEYPASLISNMMWALQNDSQTEDYGICYWKKLCLWGEVGTRLGSPLVFHRVSLVGQMRSSLACDVFSAVIEVEGWVISGWTGIVESFALGSSCCV